MFEEEEGPRVIIIYGEVGAYPCKTFTEMLKELGGSEVVTRSALL
jgi:hypothetical protein